MRCLRSLLGARYRPGMPNADVLYRCRLPSVHLVLSRSRLRWVGHVGRMGYDRLPKQLLFARSDGPRPRGRPPKAWSQLVAGELAHVASVNSKWPAAFTWPQWQKVCDRRRLWRRILREMPG